MVNESHMKFLHFSVTLIVLLLLLTACGYDDAHTVEVVDNRVQSDEKQSTVVPGDVAAPTSTPTQEPIAPTATPTADAVEATPTPTVDASLFESDGTYEPRVISVEEFENLEVQPVPCENQDEWPNMYCVPGCPPGLADCLGTNLPIALPTIPPVPPVIDEEKLWWSEPYYITKSPYAGKTPGDVTGPVGPVGNTGAKPPANGILPGLDDRDIALWFDDRENMHATYLSEYWTSRVSDEAYDLCDDAQVLRFAWRGRVLVPGDTLTESDRALIAKTRQEYQVVCDGNPWSKRYVAVGPNWYADKPTKAHPTPEHALQEILGRNPKGLGESRRAYPDNNTLFIRHIAGYHGNGRVYHLGRRFPPESNDQVVVADKATTIQDGVLRGLVHNQSQTMFARNVEITAFSQDENEKTVSGSWSWPLTVQPGEFAPFEIEDWEGRADVSNISFNISASMSPYLDITRSFSLRNGDYTYWNTKDIPLGLMVELYPDDLINGRVPDYWETGYERWLWSFGAEFKVPQSHPSLEERIGKIDLRSQDIRAYVMFWTSEIVPTDDPYRSNVTMTVTDLVDLTPYLAENYRESEWPFPDWFRMNVPLSHANQYHHVWIGGANPAPAVGLPE